MVKVKKVKKGAKSMKAKKVAKPMKKMAKGAKKLMKAKKPAAKKRVASAPKAKPMAKALPLGQQIEALEKQIYEGKKQLSSLRKKLPLEEVGDYVFKAHDGSEVKLTEMFDAHNDLILVHNMGRGCKYCTLWADGFTGFTKHLENRAGFVVISKDDVEIQKDFYQGRGWNFKMYSSFGTTFNKDMKFENETGGQMPGVSAFHKDESGKIYRTGYTWFGPGDDFCAVWPMLDLLKDGQAGWEPQYSY
jgi:predicted dithiol-disulfide oxidoreductase (DUF899 family)